MRLTFTRMADRRPVETLIERDDGVTFLMRGAGGGPDLPHDLVHAVVEEELGIHDGIWGCVADGVVWGSMRHVAGRRAAHAADRSARLKKERHAAVNRAEAVADLVSRLAGGDRVLSSQVEAAGVPAERLAAAAEVLTATNGRWAQLPPGGTWVLEWSAPAAGRASPARRHRGRAR